MSFLKITDPKKRDFIVNEFLKTRQNIQQTFLSQRVGDLSTQYELSTLFKPVADKQKDLKKGLASELKPVREGIKHVPKAVTFPQFSFITAYDDDGEEDGKAVIGNISEKNCESLLQSPALIRHLDCGIWMVSFTLGTRKQK